MIIDCREEMTHEATKKRHMIDWYEIGMREEMQNLENSI